MTWRADDQRRWEERKKQRGIVPKQPAPKPKPAIKRTATAAGLGQSIARLRSKQTAADWPDIPFARFYFR